MSIWKELTNPSSFAGEYDTASEAPMPNNIAPRPNGHGFDAEIASPAG